MTTDRSASSSTPLMPIVCAVHLALDWMLIGGVWFHSDIVQLISVGIPVSQCSLVALWAASTRKHLLLRFVAPIVAAGLCWYVLGHAIGWGMGEPASAAWALLIGVQTLAIVVPVALYSRARPIGGDQDGNPSRFTFDLRTLILWTAVIAVVLALIQYARQAMQWTYDTASWPYSDVMPILAVYHAILAMLWFWALVSGSWKWRCGKSVITLLSLGSLCVVTWYTVNQMVVGAPQLWFYELAVTTITQSVIIAATISASRISP